MRITQYRTMTNDELLNFAETRVETPLEVELLNRLTSALNAEPYTPYMAQLGGQMDLVFGTPTK